ncbi:hypothetical protein ACS0TY_015128 [Phlomoides rotata]
MRTTISVSLLLAIFYVYGANSAIFRLRNNCPNKIWPAALTGLGSPVVTGIELSPQAAQNILVSPPWSGRFWARTECSSSGGKLSCVTGDCASGQIECNGAGGIPPASLVEFTLAGADGKDFYDVSLVDGFNLPVSVSPEGGSCPSTSCPADINAGCPSDLAISGPSGAVVGCKSACLAFNQPQHCCTGAFGTPQTCPPTSYSQIFKTLCPQAYSYAYDDKTSIFTCPTGANYVITFCP